MTTEQLIAIRDAAQDSGDTQTYQTAWVALGFHRHPAFEPATPAERDRAVERLTSHPTPEAKS